MVTLLVAKRPGQDETFKADIERLEKQYDTKIQTFRIDGIKASSSDIRRSVVFDDIPKEAADFIKTNGLFPSVNYLEHVSDKAMQDFYEYSIAIYPTLSRYRLIHTINVAIRLLSQVFSMIVPRSIRMISSEHCVLLLRIRHLTLSSSGMHLQARLSRCSNSALKMRRSLAPSSSIRPAIRA